MLSSLLRDHELLLQGWVILHGLERRYNWGKNLLESLGVGSFTRPRGAVAIMDLVVMHVRPQY